MSQNAFRFAPHWEDIRNQILEFSDPITNDINIVKVDIDAIDINVINKSDNELPEYSHHGDSGVDLRAFIGTSEDKVRQVRIYPGNIHMIHTGLYVEIPYGFEIQIRPRSGLAKMKVSIANSPGTVDSGYRGEVCCLVYNNSDSPFIVNSGDRIAQAVLTPVYKIKWNKVDDLSESSRDTGGFGHTGIN